MYYSEFLLVPFYFMPCRVDGCKKQTFNSLPYEYVQTIYQLWDIPTQMLDFLFFLIDMQVK